jgi:hypothetical protein
MSTQEIPTQQPSPDAQRGPGGPGMLEPDGLGSSRPPPGGCPRWGSSRRAGRRGQGAPPGGTPGGQQIRVKQPRHADATPRRLDQG